MTVRLLQTGLSLMGQGDGSLAAQVLGLVETELHARNRLVETRLYPTLAEATRLSEENRRLEKLAREGAWEPLLLALRLQLKREQETHRFSLRPVSRSAP